MTKRLLYLPDPLVKFYRLGIGDTRNVFCSYELHDSEVKYYKEISTDEDCEKSFLFLSTFLLIGSDNRYFRGIKSNFEYFELIEIADDKE